MLLKLNFNYFNHTEILRKIIPEKYAISAFEEVGDIIHLNLHDEVLNYKHIIAWVLNKKFNKTVINKKGKIDNVYRNYEYEVLEGEEKFTTMVRESNVKIYVDLSKVYWCSRLQGERMNLIKEIESKSVVCDPFCGVGPHVLPLLKKDCKVYANDLNPDAIKCLKKSLKLNKFTCDTVYCEDAKKFLISLQNIKIDHFIFNLPEQSLDFVKFLPSFKNNNYTLHCYFFCRDNKNINDEIYEKTKYHLDIKYVKHVRKVSPSKSVYKLTIKSELLK